MSSVQAVDAGGDQGPQGARDGNFAPDRLETPPAAGLVPANDAGLDQRADQLLQEQGVALALDLDDVLHLFGQVVDAEEPADHALALGAVQALEVDAGLELPPAPDLVGPADPLLHPVPHGPDRLVDLRGRLDGPHGVVLVGPGDAEDGHRAVADVGLDGAVVLGDDRRDLLEDALGEGFDLLRVQLLGHLGVAGEVGEEDGHVLPLALGEGFATLALPGTVDPAPALGTVTVLRDVRMPAPGARRAQRKAALTAAAGIVAVFILAGCAPHVPSRTEPRLSCRETGLLVARFMAPSRGRLSAAGFQPDVMGCSFCVP